jgi:FkbM family methyltransferase
MIRQLIYILAYYFYKYLPGIYKSLYFFYKNISDGKRIKLLRNIIKKGDTILDIGGNIGFYSIVMAKLSGDKGHIHVFEPNPENFKRLQFNTRGYKNIKNYNIAVGQKDGVIKMYCSKYLNVDHQTYNSGENREEIKVNCSALDSLFDETIKINVIKIDIQGFDYYAVQGMKNIINRAGNIFILGELWPYGLKKAGSSVNEYLSYLESMGLKIEFVDNADRNSLSDYSNNKNFYTDFLAYKV